MSATQAWAREHFKGFENILIPTMTADRRQLDEAAVRHDVRQAMAHGFFGSFCAGIGLSTSEMKQFLAIAADEARGKLCLSMFVAVIRATYERIHVAVTCDPDAAFWAGRTAAREVVGR